MYSTLSCLKAFKKISLKNKIQAWTGFEYMTSATPVQRSYQLSYQAELGNGHLWVWNIPVDGEDVKCIYEIHIFV